MSAISFRSVFSFPSPSFIDIMRLLRFRDLIVVMFFRPLNFCMMALISSWRSCFLMFLIVLRMSLLTCARSCRRLDVMVWRRIISCSSCCSCVVSVRCRCCSLSRSLMCFEVELLSCCASVRLLLIWSHRSPKFSLSRTSSSISSNRCA